MVVAFTIFFLEIVYYKCHKVKFATGSLVKYVSAHLFFLDPLCPISNSYETIQCPFTASKIFTIFARFLGHTHESSSDLDSRVSVEVEACFRYARPNLRRYTHIL